MKHLFAFLTLFCVSAGVFAAAEPAAPAIDKKAVAQLNKQGLELFARLCEADTSGNVFISPFSVSSAFGMVYAGSKNATHAQIAKAVGFPADVKTASALLSQIMKSYEPADAKNRAVFIANSVWAAKDQTLLPDYTATVKQYFGGAFYREDFSQPATLVKKINGYIEEHTGNMIKDMLAENDISADQKMILLNTLYFNAAWRKKFSPDQTNTLRFNLFGKDKKFIETDLMFQETSFPYFSSTADNVHGIVMAYEQKPFEMVLLMPKKESADNGEADMKKLIAALPEKFDTWRGSARFVKVQTLVPKLKIKGKFNLIPSLKKLGMIDAFDKNADFSGISGKRDLYINFVLHQTALEMDEKSTKAAAATAIGMNLMSAGPPEQPVEFYADRPFLAVIRDNDTGNILFVGRVTNPKQ